MMDAHEARADAKAAKAKAKALRPWYRKKRYWCLSLVVVIVIIIVATTAGGGGNNPTTAASPDGATGPGATTATAAPSTPGLGTPAADGDFSFTVTDWKCGITQLGNDPDFSEQAPAGTQWCEATMSVQNVKDEAQDFFGSNQYAYDAAGKKISSDDTAWAYIPDDSQSLDATVNPGVTITAVVPFQISTSDSITKLELHDSAFSGGVSVAVS